MEENERHPVNQAVCVAEDGSLGRGPKKSPDGAQYTGDLRPETRIAVNGIAVNEPAAMPTGPLGSTVHLRRRTLRTPPERKRQCSIRSK